MAADVEPPSEKRHFGGSLWIQLFTSYKVLIMWISIEDKFPPESEDVLLFREDGSCVVASLEDYYDAESGHFVLKIKETEGINTGYSKGGLELDATVEITHWMLLPKDPPCDASCIEVRLGMVKAIMASEMERLLAEHRNGATSAGMRHDTVAVYYNLLFGPDVHQLTHHTFVCSYDGDGACTKIERSLGPNSLE
jgi:hypothetical protein